MANVHTYRNAGIDLHALTYPENPHAHLHILRHTHALANGDVDSNTNVDRSPNVDLDASSDTVFYPHNGVDAYAYADTIAQFHAHAVPDCGRLRQHSRTGSPLTAESPCARSR
ncbi:MAG: hypothetical protein PVH80_06585 [Anaerolineae bacterium]|jgi:hypothetical protein